MTIVEEQPLNIDIVNNRAERLWKARRSVIASYLARFSSIAVYLISVPLTLKYLETQQYGLWLTLGSLITYVSSIDLGFGLGLQNKVAETRGKDRLELVGEFLSTAVVTMIILGVGVSLAGVLFAKLAPVNVWFHITSLRVEQDFRNALIVAALFFSLSLPLRVINNAQTGFQESYFNDLWSIASSVLGLMAVIIVVSTKGELVQLSLATFAFTQLVGIANVGLFFARHPEARFSFRKFHLRWLSDLFLIGWQFFVIQIYTLIIWQTDNFVIATQKNAESVVPYAVAFRLIWVPLNLLSSIPSALWPAYTEAKARGDWAWIQTTYKWTTLLTVGVASVIAVCLFSWGQEFILVWAGPEAQGNSWLMAGLCCYLILGQWTNCNAMLVNAIGRISDQVISGFLEAALNFGLSLYLIQAWDVAGVAWATTISCLVISSWFLSWSIWHSTHHQIEPPWRSAFGLLMLSVVVGLLAGFFGQNFLPFTWPALVRISIGVVFIGICSMGAVYLFLPKSARYQIAHVLRVRPAFLN